MTKAFKTILLVFAGLLACILSTPAFGSTNSLYQSDEFAVSAFGQYQPIGLVAGDSQYGAGLQAEYFVTRNIGVTLATSKNEVSNGGFFQNLSIGPALRLPLGKTGLAPYGIGGIGFDFDHQNDRYYYAGAGLEYRWTKYVSTFADWQFQWRDYLATDDRAQFVRVGLKWTF